MTLNDRPWHGIMILPFPYITTPYAIPPYRFSDVECCSVIPPYRFSDVECGSAIPPYRFSDVECGSAIPPYRFSDVECCRHPSLPAFRCGMLPASSGGWPCRHLAADWWLPSPGRTAQSPRSARPTATWTWPSSSPSPRGRAWRELAGTSLRAAGGGGFRQCPQITILLGRRSEKFEFQKDCKSEKFATKCEFFIWLMRKVMAISVWERWQQGWNSQFCFWSQRIYNGGRICYISYVFMVPY